MVAMLLRGVYLSYSVSTYIDLIIVFKGINAAARCGKMVLIGSQLNSCQHLALKDSSS
jgi:hypothetical protein